MSPRLFLFIVFMAIVLFNILTVRYRQARSAELEVKLMGFARSKGDIMTIDDISKELNIPIYDAKILTRKFVSKGKMIPHDSSEEFVYISNNQS